jgi:hypothetical protein
LLEENTFISEIKTMTEEQTAKNNWLLKWLKNMKNTKANFKKVRASPYASLTFSLKIRKLVIYMLIPWLAYLGYKMVAGIRLDGFMGTFQKVVSMGIMAYIIWRIYSTIPIAQKQIEYYKKYPHTINYCPTNVKEDVDSILNKIKENSEKKLNETQEVKNNVRKEENNTKSSSTDTSSGAS